MTNQIQKLIENLKKEIEETKEELDNIDKSQIDTSYHKETLIDYENLKAQLQFAEKLMKLRDKEEKERLNKLIEKIKKDIKKIQEVDLDLGGAGIYVRVRELNKILNETIEKCQK